MTEPLKNGTKVKIVNYFKTLDYTEGTVVGIINNDQPIIGITYAIMISEGQWSPDYDHPVIAVPEINLVVMNCLVYRVDDQTWHQIMDQTGDNL